jgi:hypothetical protein
MGYDVHITRRQNWFDHGPPAISLEDWLATVKNDPEMRWVGFAEASVEGSTLRVESPGLATWTQYSGTGIDGNQRGLIGMAAESS